jgi:UDP-glucose 4-epimerase
MKLLVTGGAGYIGSIVAEIAVESGHQVVVLDDLRAGHRAAVPPECRFVHGSIGASEALKAAFNFGPFDAVLHLAAEAAIEASVSDPAVYFRANLVEGLALLDAMRMHGIERLIFSSTAATYGEPSELPIDESHRQEPVNAYGESKLQFERVLRWYHRAYGLRAVAFRYFNASGATEARGESRSVETHLLPLVLDAVAGRRPPIRVFGTDYPTPDGTCIRDYVHVIDIAKAHLLALERVDALGLAFLNIGSGRGYSVREVLDAVASTLGVPVPNETAPRRKGDPAVLVARTDRAHEELGWRPEHPGLEPIIESAWKWRKRHPHGYGPDWQ